MEKIGKAAEVSKELDPRSQASCLGLPSGDGTKTRGGPRSPALRLRRTEIEALSQSASKRAVLRVLDDAIEELDQETAAE